MISAENETKLDEQVTNLHSSWHTGPQLRYELQQRTQTAGLAIAMTGSAGARHTNRKSQSAPKITCFARTIPARKRPLLRPTFAFATAVNFLLGSGIFDADQCKNQRVENLKPSRRFSGTALCTKNPKTSSALRHIASKVSCQKMRPADNTSPPKGGYIPRRRAQEPLNVLRGGGSSLSRGNHEPPTIPSSTLLPAAQKHFEGRIHQAKNYLHFCSHQKTNNQKLEWSSAEASSNTVLDLGPVEVVRLKFCHWSMIPTKRVYQVSYSR